jgi:WXG100 family type VII secretion target
MAKTKWNIDIDFAAAKKQADELDKIASELENAANKDLQDDLDNIKNNWKGTNANAYIEKGKTVKENIKGVAKSLRTAAKTIRKIAKQTRDAELAALELAKKRNK